MREHQFLFPMFSMLLKNPDWRENNVHIKESSLAAMLFGRLSPV